jgi:signal peptidase II
MRRGLRAALTVSATVALDLLTKHLAATRIGPSETVEILPFFHLVNVRNVGAAFGMMRGLGNGFFIAVSIAAIAVIVYLIVRGDLGTLAPSLILGGALGNLADRVTLGYVRDFLDFFVGPYHWPAFNVADSALTVGLGLVMLGALRARPSVPE